MSRGVPKFEKDVISSPAKASRGIETVGDGEELHPTHSGGPKKPQLVLTECLSDTTCGAYALWPTKTFQRYYIMCQ